MRASDLYVNETDFADLDIEAAAQRLSLALQCRTTSSTEDHWEFDRLQALMRRSYPSVMAEGRFELIGHSVLITLPGSDTSLLPALFMSHQDVVPVVEGTESDWHYPPYSGAIADGYIWGRGAQDIKQQVFGTLEAAEYLLSHGNRFRRTVYLAFGEDEETFNTGSRAIAEALRSRGVKLAFLLDEGGGAIDTASAFGAPYTCVSYINIMEKGYADLELSVKSIGGHSSKPFGGTSLGRLSRAISDIADNPFAAELSPPMRLTMEALAPYITEEPLKSLCRNVDKNAAAIAAYCMTRRELFPFVTTTIAPTMIQGGSSACNVMPQDMRAVINFRIACGHTAAELMEHCRSVIRDKDVELRFLQANDPSEVARTDGEGYAALVKAMERYYENVVFVPAMTVGATDARSYEGICDTCLRCSPFLSEEKLVSACVHGTDERIAVRTYAQGLRVLISLMNDTCV